MSTPTSAQPGPAAGGAAAATLSGVACPFCGLVCDDLELEVDAVRVAQRSRGCARSARMFAVALPRGSAAAVAGGPVALDAAIEQAAGILRGAAQPVFAGLGTDVAGVRATLALADRLGAIVDHRSSAALLRNTASMRRGRWMTTTFAEVRNRADLIVLAGCDVAARHPRFFERIAFGDGMFVEPVERSLVCVGAPEAAAGAQAAAKAAGVASPTVIGCAQSDLGEVFAALNALLVGAALSADAVAGVPLAALAELAARMRKARYGVVVWTAADIDFVHADLAIDAIMSCVVTLNETTRFAGLPIAGSGGDLTANQASLWQTGLPLPLSFAGGGVDFDPLRYRVGAALAGEAADALVWIASFDAAHTPPATRVPTIVLGRAGMRVAPAPAVQIDVGTPGLDHGGHCMRGDGVVAMRLRRVVASPLPSVADVLTRIGAAL